MALKRVDLPTLGRPTMPARRLMLILALRPEEKRRAALPPMPRLRCQRKRSAEEAHGEGKGAVAGTAGVRVNPTNAEPRARDIVAMGARRESSGAGSGEEWAAVAREGDGGGVRRDTRDEREIEV
jgi:hypothetical protein